MKNAHRTSHIAHRTSHIAHRTSRFALAASALLLAGITAAHAQSLSCVSVPAGGTTTLEVKTGPGWKFFYSNTPSPDITNPGWQTPHASSCSGGPACHSFWQTIQGTATLGGAQWLAPMPLSGTSGPVDFSYLSPAITVDPRVNLGTLSMQILGATDDFYNSTGVINGNPLALHEDSTSQTSLSLHSGSPDTQTFAAGTTPMNHWQHGVNYILARTRDAGANYDFSSSWPTTPTGFIAKYTLTATCMAASSHAVPANHPLALTLGALALAGLAGLKLRRRKA